MSLRKKFLILILSIFFIFFLAPKEYYPIKIEIRVKSIFGAFRGNHFHGGIDFSTFGKKGIPVRAIEDGYLFRLSNKFYGFGKAVYIKHKNFISVYGHLDKFEEKRLKLETLSKSLSKKFDGRYFGDYFFKSKKIFVKRGQIIAYSGETGAGPPHLHFEIRDLNNNPINTFNIIYIKDKIPPKIGKFIISPLKYYSLINGELKPLIIRVNNGKKPPKFFISGPFSITITAWDKYYKYDRTAIYGWKVYIDDRLLSSIKFDKIPFNKSHQVALIYDVNKSSYKKDYFFYNVYPYYGRGLGVNTALPEALFKSLSEGEHILKVIVYDFWGNKVEKALRFIKVSFNKINVKGISKIDPITFRLELNKPLSSIFFEVKGAEEEFFYEPYFKIEDNTILFKIPRPFDGDRYTLRIKRCKYCNWTYKTFEITTADIDGFTLLKGKNWITIDSLKKGHWFFGNKRGILRKGKNVIPIYNGILKLKVSKEVYTFLFKKNGLKSSKKVVLLPDDFAEISNRGSESALSVLNKFYSRVKPDFREFFLVKKGEEKKINFNHFTLEFGKNSLFKDFYFKLTKNNVKFDPSLPPIGGTLKILPDSFPFKNSIIIKTYIPDYPFLKRVGIFRLNTNTGKWVNLKSHIVNNKIISKIWIGGIYSLLADESPPELKLYFPKNRRSYRRVRRAVAIIRDKGKGIDYHKTYFVINGRKVWAYYDPDKASMFYNIGRFVKKGRNTLSAIVYDYAGNRTKKSIIFFKK